MSLHSMPKTPPGLGRSGRAAGAVHRHVGSGRGAAAGRLSARRSRRASPDGAGRAGQGRSGAADHPRPAQAARIVHGRVSRAAENGEPPCDLIYEEYHIRRGAGNDGHAAATISTRFPRSADALRRLMGTEDFSANDAAVRRPRRASRASPPARSSTTSICWSSWAKARSAASFWPGRSRCSGWWR